jgi:transposase
MSHLTLNQKLTIIRMKLHDGKPSRTIATAVGCSRREVYWVLEQFRSGDSLDRKCGSGRPATMDAAMKLSLEKAIRRKRNATAAQLQVLMSKQSGRRVSERTIQRARRELKYHPVHASLKPQLTEAHMKLRLLFCQTHKNDSTRDWVFMDEMGVGIDTHRNVYWIKPGEARPIHEVSAGNIRLNVWGAVWYEGKSTLNISSLTFNNRHYFDVLQSDLYPFLPLHNKRFIQDGASWHWTQNITEWCLQQGISLMEDFPPKSPDLNAIEFVWGWIKHTVAAARPHDRKSLEVALRQAWDSLEQSTICHFIDHLQTTLNEIIAAEGSAVFKYDRVSPGGQSQ